MRVDNRKGVGYSGRETGTNIAAAGAVDRELGGGIYRKKWNYDKQKTKKNIQMQMLNFWILDFLNVKTQNFKIV